MTLDLCTSFGDRLGLETCSVRDLWQSHVLVVGPEENVPGRVTLVRLVLETPTNLSFLATTRVLAVEIAHLLIPMFRVFYGTKSLNTAE